MTVNRIIEDKELGPLFVRVNARARRLTFRTKEDGIYVTVPPRTSLAEVESAIEQLRPRLKAARQKLVRKLIDLDYRIDTEFFKLTLVSGQRERFLSRSELGEMQIICPPDADFSDEKLQAWLRKVIEEALRRNAKIVLPPRLYMLSMQHNLPYKSVKINSSSGRWGSCSAQGNINLSYYLVLLPKHLIDYVLLQRHYTTPAVTLQRYCTPFAALLQNSCSVTAKVLQQHCKRSAVTVQEVCSSFAVSLSVKQGTTYRPY